MILQDFQDLIYDLVSTYFVGATVIIANQNTAQPKPPSVRLTFGQIRYNKIMEQFGAEMQREFLGNISVTVELFTLGERIAAESEVAPAINSSASDLSSFIMFLQSDYSILFQQKNNISISIDGDVTPINSSLNGTMNAFRASVQLSARFVVSTYGFSNMQINGQPYSQTVSGGGSQELADMKTGAFDTVEINEKE